MPTEQDKQQSCIHFAQWEVSDPHWGVGVLLQHTSEARVTRQPVAGSPQNTDSAQT